jgi:hypothetical protein
MGAKGNKAICNCEISFKTLLDNLLLPYTHPKHLRDYPIFLTGMRGMLLLFLAVIMLSIVFAFVYDSLITQVKRAIRSLRKSNHEVKPTTKV